MQAEQGVFDKKSMFMLAKCDASKQQVHVIELPLDSYGGRNFFKKKKKKIFTPQNGLLLICSGKKFVVCFSIELNK